MRMGDDTMAMKKDVSSVVQLMHMRSLLIRSRLPGSQRRGMALSISG